MKESSAFSKYALNDIQDVHSCDCYAVDWLSLTEGGVALTPNGNGITLTVGDYKVKVIVGVDVLVSSDLILGETQTHIVGIVARQHTTIHKLQMATNPHATTFANIDVQPF